MNSCLRTENVRGKNNVGENGKSCFNEIFMSQYEYFLPKVYLQVRYSCCRDDAKHNHEHAPDHGRRDSGEYGAHFTKHTHDNHQDSAGYYHHATANL